MAGKRRALISVFYKEGIEEFAAGLEKLGFDIISSGGTARHLKEKGVRVMDVMALTGLPPILSHRVVTLHPKIHGGILAKQTPEHEKELERYGIPRFHLICVDLYPVWEALAKENATIESVMESTDIGGPAMLRAAAKNHDNGVVVICDPFDRQRVLEELQKQGEVSEKLRLELAAKVFGLMARYDASIWQFLAAQRGEEVLSLFLQHVSQLAYAENRSQNPADLFALPGDDPLAMTKFNVISGKPSYISMADGSRILEVLCFIAETFRQWKGKVPHIVVAGKHGNPCGAAIGWQNKFEVIRRALLGDPLAVMGGEVITNFEIDYNLAQTLFETGTGINIGRDKWGLDLILAPSFSEVAIEILGKREKRRLLANPALSDPFLSPKQWVYQPVRGGFLRQKAPNFILTPDAIKEWVGEPLSEEDFESLIIAWAVCWRASSNTVALAKDRMLIALGCGQQDRVACVQLCLSRAYRAGHCPKESVFASDAFFPYAKGKEDVKAIESLAAAALEAFQDKNRDPRQILKEMADRVDEREGPELLIDAGCIGGVVPADGKNLAQVQELFKQAGLSVAFLAPENRGFAKH